MFIRVQEITGKIIDNFQGVIFYALSIVILCYFFRGVKILYGVVQVGGRWERGE